jgi:error-prone DNA polymerase
MGFYQPAQLVRDAREHGIEVRHPDINCSDWDCTLEPSSSAAHCAVRLGLRLIGGLPEESARQLVAARSSGYADVASLWQRGGASWSVLERLAAADTFRSIGLDRRAALWAIKGLDSKMLQAGSKRATGPSSPILTWTETGDLFAEPAVDLPSITLGEHVVEDYSAIGLSLKAHPCAFFRADLESRGVITSAKHWDEKLAGRRVTVAGLVLVRQRPGTAKGVIFLTLEDETGIVNVVVWPNVFEKNRRTVMSAQMLLVRGKIERQGLVIHVVAEQLVDLTDELRTLGEGTAGMPRIDKEVREGSWKPKSRDFH